MVANNIEKLIPEKEIAEFVSRLRTAASENLQCVILYGSAAGGEFHPEFSNVNLLCIVRETSFATLSALGPAVGWWNRKKHSAPLVLTQQELERSADVFSIEFLDMQRRHRVLFGEDLLANLHIPMQHHRAQVEYELREKLIVLREHLLLAAANKNQIVGFAFALFARFYHTLPARADRVGRRGPGFQAGSRPGPRRPDKIRSLSLPAIARHSRTQGRPQTV